ncbi:glycosyltransferase [Trichloromonas sp.]|uniref:glycosyltransferase n=1 Tax=Trichloromonas sp. TaxID=3069249 RepID=UPI003D817DEA
MGGLFWLGLLILAVYGAIAVDVLIGSRKLRFLRDVPQTLPAEVPSVSLIAAARNEERNIAEAVRSLLQLDYPKLELILVDDRSEDRTGTLLDELAQNEPRLQVLHVTELPTGWLGKNHALWLGSQQAVGELLLFTDADVVMRPDTLKRAVALLSADRLDHLAATPEAHMPKLLLNMFIAAFGLFFAIFTRPWKARDPNSRCHIGIGAFNLVRAAAYRKVGGHRTIALRPDDDLKLGKIVKKAGCRQDLAYGTGLLQVEWYSSVGQLIRGLEKNAYAGTDYRLWLALGGVAFQLVASVWPYLAVLVTSGPTRLVYLAVVALLTLLIADSARFHGFSPWYAAGFPVTAALFAYIVLRTAILNHLHGGITWRGTFYPLDELRRNRV